MSRRSLDIIIAGHNKTRRAFGQVGRGLEGIRSSMLNVRNLAVGGLGLFALTRITRSFVMSAAELGTEMANVSTMLTDLDQHRMPEFTAEIRRMTIEFGQGSATLSKGLYDILSASIAASDGLDVLNTAAKAAVAGVTQTGIAVDGITSLLKAYGLETERNAHVSDLMFATVKSGKITFEQLASNIGKVAPMARAARMSMEDMLAAIATMTRQGLNAEQATTRLVAVIKTMPEAVGDLLSAVESFRGMNLAEILAIVPETRAAAGIAALSADIQGLGRDMEFMRNAAGSAQEAFDKIAATAGFKLGQAKQQLIDLGRSIGEAVIPSLLVMTEELTANREGLQQWAQGLAKRGVEVGKWISANRELIFGLGKVGLAIAGVIVLGPPLIGMIKTVGVASMLLYKNPVILLAAGVTVLVGKLVLWNRGMNRIMGTLGNITPMVQNLAKANREGMAAVRAEHTEMVTKAKRLAELQGKQKLTNVEMLEAKGLVHDLTTAYPELSDKIDGLGRSAIHLAEALERMNESFGASVKLTVEAQLQAAEGHLAELESQVDRTLEMSHLVGRTVSDVLAERSKARGGRGPFPALVEEEMISRQIVEATNLFNSLEVLHLDIAKAQDEIARLRDVGSGDAAGVMSAPKIAGLGTEALDKAMRLRREAAKREGAERVKREQSVAGEIARLRVITREKGLQRELSLLKLAQSKELAIAKSTREQRLVLMKFDLLKIQAQQEAAAGGGGGRGAPLLESRTLMLRGGQARRDRGQETVAQNERNTRSMAKLMKDVKTGIDQVARGIGKLVEGKGGAMTIPVVDFKDRR